MEEGLPRPNRNAGIAPYILFFVFIGAAFAWMTINTHLPWWAAVLIVSPQTAAVVYALVIKERDAEEFDPEPRKYGIGVAVICAVFTLLAGIQIGTYFFLVYLYGWERVRSEHLSTSHPCGVVV